VQFTSSQVLAYLGGVAAVVAIVANVIKIYESVKLWLAERGRHRPLKPIATLTASQTLRNFKSSFFCPIFLDTCHVMRLDTCQVM